MTGASAAVAGDLRPARGEAEVRSPPGAPRAGAAREPSRGDRRRARAERAGARPVRAPPLRGRPPTAASGGYRIFSALDRAGPGAARGPVLHARRGRGWGGASGRPYLPRAFSVAEAEPRGRRRAARLPGRGGRPGDRAARRARAGRAGCGSPDRSARPFSAPARAGAGRGRGDPRRRRHRHRAAGDPAPPARRPRRRRPDPARLPRPRALRRAGRAVRLLPRSGWRARTATPATAAT